MAKKIKVVFVKHSAYNADNDETIAKRNARLRDDAYGNSPIKPKPKPKQVVKPKRKRKLTPLHPKYVLVKGKFFVSLHNAHVIAYRKVNPLPKQAKVKVQVHNVKEYPYFGDGSIFNSAYTVSGGACSPR